MESYNSYLVCALHASSVRSIINIVKVNAWEPSSVTQIRDGRKDEDMFNCMCIFKNYSNIYFEVMMLPVLVNIFIIAFLM
jgi:hypothetical protein